MQSVDDIRCKRLRLRRPTSDDVGRHFAIHGDPQTNRFNPAGPLTSEEQSVQAIAGWIEHWERHGFGYWAAHLHDDEQVIGFGGVARVPIAGVERLNLYFRYAPCAWGKGFARELGEAATAFVKGHLPAERLYAYTRPDNIPSRTLIQRLGLIAVGAVDDVPGEPPSPLFATEI